MLKKIDAGAAHRAHAETLDALQSITAALVSDFNRLPIGEYAAMISAANRLEDASASCSAAASRLRESIKAVK